MTNLKLYPELSTRSRRAIVKTKTRYGKRYQYRPRIDLVRRLASKFGMTPEAVISQLKAERKALLS